MPRRNRRTNRQRGPKGGRQNFTFCNTVEIRSGVNSSFHLQELLGSSIFFRKVVLKKFVVQALPLQVPGETVEYSPSVQAQLQVSGPIWTGSEQSFVPNKPFRLLSRVNPTKLEIRAFLPTMKVPLDSENNQHRLKIAMSSIDDEDQFMYCRVTTYVRLLPQENLITVQPNARQANDDEAQTTGMHSDN